MEILRGDQIPAAYAALAQTVGAVLLGGPSPISERLRTHLAVASIDRVEVTGAGAFVCFDLPADVTLVEPSNFSAGEALLDLEGLELGAGCLLEVREGRLDNLEFYTFSESWPDRIVVRGIELVELVGTSGWRQATVQ